MKTHIYFTAILLFLGFSSCKRCLTCDCVKDGVSYEERNCAYGGGSSNRTQDTWVEYLTDEEGKDYDSCECRED